MKTWMAMLATLMLLLSACPAWAQIAFTDALGRDVTLEESPQRVVSLYGSYAEAWLQCGGTLVGTTEDAVSERALALGEDVQIIGTVKSPSMELVAALEPDFILLSSDIATQAELLPVLESLGIPFAYFSVNTAQAFMDMARILCDITGREDLYASLVESVQTPIEESIARAQADARYGQQTALLLRAYTTGVKAKGADNLAGAVLADMGLVNLADRDGALLENLSLEQILVDDPDYIFITTMGSDHDKAMEALAESLSGNPAWASLSAVQNGRVIELPRELFHYKPNARWAEAYETIEGIVYAP